MQTELLPETRPFVPERERATEIETETDRQRERGAGGGSGRGRGVYVCVWRGGRVTKWLRGDNPADVFSRHLDSLASSAELQGETIHAVSIERRVLMQISAVSLTAVESGTLQRRTRLLNPHDHLLHSPPPPPPFISRGYGGGLVKQTADGDLTHILLLCETVRHTDCVPRRYGCPLGRGGVSSSSTMR